MTYEMIIRCQKTPAVDISYC